MELCDDGLTLDHRINAMVTNGERMASVHQLFQGIQYLHGLKIVHRDLKPANTIQGRRSEDLRYGAEPPAADGCETSPSPPLLSCHVSRSHKIVVTGVNRPRRLQQVPQAAEHLAGCLQRSLAGRTALYHLKVG